MDAAKPDLQQRIRCAMDNLEGVMYVLDALADMRGEETNALRNQARELDRIFTALESIAGEMESAQ